MDSNDWSTVCEILEPASAVLLNRVSVSPSIPLPWWLAPFAADPVKQKSNKIARGAIFVARSFSSSFGCMCHENLENMLTIVQCGIYEPLSYPNP
jgi:hypothetical protein